MTEFCTKQYEKLTNEISETLGQIASIEYYAIIFSGGVYTWIFTKESIVPILAFFIPPLIVTLLGVVSYGMYNRLQLISEYIQIEYENKEYPKEDIDFEHSKNMGWETFLNLKNSKILISSRKLMWIFHLLITLGLAIYAVIYL
tara:strand:- start:28614 stop:29045 length:432 start_codon:yes stop_codon:yes gene_type:complete